MENPPTRWIITGGAGFLGTNLLHALRPEDGEVVVISRSPARWPVMRPGIRYLEQDIRDIEAYRHELIPGSVVIHLASASYPGKAERMIESDIQDSILGTVRLALACAEQGVRSFLFLSSGGAVYGDQPVYPVSEDVLPRPISTYAAMKLTIEQYLSVIHHQRGLSSAILRTGNCYGLWHTGSGQGAVNVFLQKARSGQAIEIWGDGEQVRDYVSATDVAEAIRAVALAHTSGCDTFNIGTGLGHSLKDVLQAIEKATGLLPSVQFRPARGVDVMKNVLDVSKMYERFRWKPQTSFQNGVQETFAWMQRTTPNEGE